MVFGLCSLQNGSVDAGRLPGGLAPTEVGALSDGLLAAMVPGGAGVFSFFEQADHGVAACLDVGYGAINGRRPSHLA
jgi:hypothetical protein